MPAALPTGAVPCRCPLAAAGMIPVCLCHLGLGSYRLDSSAWLRRRRALDDAAASAAHSLVGCSLNVRPGHCRGMYLSSNVIVCAQCLLKIAFEGQACD